ncbi:MAG: hypothetical protein IKC28_08535 [Clostridia bacterium]|nr:hypothetical protein [Clostridia bacterium]
MRLLLAMPDPLLAEEIRIRLYARWEGWEIAVCTSATEAEAMLLDGDFDLLLLDAGISGDKGAALLDWLAAWQFPCPPRVLFLCNSEDKPKVQTDCCVPREASPEKLCHLIEILAKKPLPALAMRSQQRLSDMIQAFLDELSTPHRLKGRAYAAWLLCQLVPSPLGEELPMGQWYAQCARAYGTTAAAVERCLRIAVEGVFTQGSMQGIERCFGATVDPEKGKPTNRRFLLEAARLLRCRLMAHSLAETRSLNSSEMHHSPAAPTSV